VRRSLGVMGEVFACTAGAGCMAIHESTSPGGLGTAASGMAKAQTASGCKRWESAHVWLPTLAVLT